MFKIGDFSKLGQVSTRMLRHYDKLGLLVPEHTDEWTSYRYYSVEQLAQLHRIIALKELGLTLQQIGDLLANDEQLSVEQLQGMLLLKQAELEQELVEKQTRLDHIGIRLQQLAEQERPFPYEVIIKSVPAQTIASIRQKVPHMHEMGHYCELLYQQLYAGLKDLNIEPQQPEIALYHAQEYADIDIDVEMAVLISDEFHIQPPQHDLVQFRTLPAQDKLASLIYKGPFQGGSHAALSLLTWVGTHNYLPLPPLRELRLSGPAHTKGKLQKMPILEYQLPIQSRNT